MSESRKRKTDGTSEGVLDVVTSRATKITLLITTCAALLGAAVTFRDQIVAIFGTEPPTVSLPECFIPTIEYPSPVVVNKWDSMKPLLTGRNDCRETLAVYVAFKARRGETVQIEAPFGGGSGCEAGNPECWEQFSPESGNQMMELTPPRLTLLKRPLGEPAVVQINWIVYAVDTRKQIRAGNLTISLVDDLQALAGNSASPRS